MTLNRESAIGNRESGFGNRVARRSRGWLVALASAATVAIASKPARAQEGGIAVGSTAPSASVQTLDGKKVELSQYLGHGPVVLEFWATWCPLCKQLEPQMQTARSKYAGKVTFVSVGVPQNQTAEKQRAFAAEHKIGGEFVFDADGAAIKAYSAPHTSYLVVIDANGKVVYTGVGGTQDVDAAIGKAL